MEKITYLKVMIVNLGWVTVELLTYIPVAVSCGVGVSLIILNILKIRDYINKKKTK